MRLHILERGGPGHRMWFVLWLLEHGFAGVPVTLHLGDEYLEHPAVARLRSLGRADLDLRVLPPEGARHDGASALSSIRRSLQHLRTYRRSLRDAGWHPGEGVFIPYVDDLVIALAFCPGSLRRAPLVALGMRADFYFRECGIGGSPKRMRALKALAYRRILARDTLRGFLTNQRPFAEYAARRFDTDRVVWYPDPCIPPAEADAALPAELTGRDGRRPLLVSFGHQTLRKGVDPLLRLLQLPEWPGDGAAVLAGICDDAVRARLARDDAAGLVRSGRLTVIDRLIDDGEAWALFAAADAIWVAYDDHLYMSGCLVSAGAHAKPVIGCADGIIGYHVRGDRLGAVIDPTRDEDLAGAARFLSRPDELAACGARCRAAFADHTMERFVSVVERTVRRALDPETRGAGR